MYTFMIWYDLYDMHNVLYDSWTRMIYEYLRYTDTIPNVLHTILYVSYDMYRVSYDADNYALINY